MDDRPVSADLAPVLATYGAPGIQAGDMLVSAYQFPGVSALPRRLGRCTLPHAVKVEADRMG